MSAINWIRFEKLIRSHTNFLLVSHIRPDCDALGSELGMAGVLDALGKHVMIANGHACPPNLTFIDPHKRLKQIGETAFVDQFNDIDCVLVLDTSAWAQLGAMGDILREMKCQKMILDHHVSSDDLGAESFKDTTAEATGRLVVDAADQLGVPLTREIAMPLYAAIATDTGWFRFGSTTPYTYDVARRLVEAGAEPSKIYNSLYEQETLARVKLRGSILAHTQTELHGRLVYTAAHKQDFESSGALPSDTEDVINLTLAIAGTEVAVIFVEQPTGGFKLSFRSRTPKVSCAALAETFGGGGHKAAAGAFVDEPWPQVRETVLDRVRAAMG